VDLPLIRATVQSLLGGKPPTPHATPTTASAVLTSVVNVSNATGRSGRATQLLKALTQNGYRTGAAITHPTLLQDSVVQYPPGADAEASALAATLGGLATQQSASVPSGTLNVIIGASFTMPPTLGTATTGSGSASLPAPATAVPATGGGRAGPAPNQLSAMSAGGIPCVK
jgi:hypothetical protein